MFIFFSAVLVSTSLSTSIVNVEGTNVEVSILDETLEEDEKLHGVVLDFLKGKRVTTVFNSLNSTIDISVMDSIFRPPIS